MNAALGRIGIASTSYHCNTGMQLLSPATCVMRRRGKLSIAKLQPQELCVHPLITRCLCRLAPGLSHDDAR